MTPTEARNHGAIARRHTRLTPGDVIAGLSVAAVLIPQSLAYAGLAGMPPERGLYAAALPPIAAALFACSPYLQTGPVALTSLLTFGALSIHATPGSDEYIELGIVLALVVGAIRVLLGLVHGGVVAYLLSEPVLIGFVPGAAILICLSQLPAALGTPPTGHGIVANALDALAHPSLWDWTSIGLAVITVALMKGAARLHRLVPGVLLAVIGSIAWSSATDYSGATVGTIRLGLPEFPTGIDPGSLPLLLVSGLIIALVGFAEPSAIARTFATVERQRWDASQELVSQGAANLASAVSGGFPVGGSFSRSSLNRQAGARTRWAGAVTGVAVLCFLPFATVLAPLPLSVLAAIVIVAALGLARTRPLVRLIRLSRWQAAVAWTTFAATLALSPHVEYAVLLGVGMAILVHLLREMVVDIVVSFEGDTLTFRPRGVLWFASSKVIEDAFAVAIANHPRARKVDIDLAGVGRLDVTSALVLRRMLADARAAKLDARLIDIPPRARRFLLPVLESEDEPL
ncbi:MAG: SulP family inorganic anion transporter [Thermoleophilia bacterium]